MKSPKLFGTAMPGIAIGTAKARALQETGAPFLTARGPGYTAKVKNGFVSVTATESNLEVARPSLWACDPLNSQALVEPRKKEKVLVGTKYASPTGVRNITMHPLWVGGGRMLTIRTDTVVFPLVDKNYWPVLIRPTVVTEVLPGDEQELRSSVSFQPTGSTDYFVRSMFVTGPDAAQHRWGYSFLAPTVEAAYPGILPASRPATSVTAYLGGVNRTTGAAVAPTPVALPAESGRVHFGGAVFCAGPGKLVTLIAVAEQATGAPVSDPTYLKPRINPFLCTSSDHGATWTRTEATFLAGKLAEEWSIGAGSALAGNRLCWINRQLQELADTFWAVYIGAGVTLFFIRRLGTNWLGGTGTFHVECFKFESGIVTELPWSGSGEDPGAYDTPFNDSEYLFRCASACFGTGCAVVSNAYPVSGSSFIRLEFTRDFGATWQTSDYVPWQYVLQPVVLAPYESPEKPGKILFVEKVPGGASNVWKTDGTFATFTNIGKLTRSVLETNYAVPFLKRTTFNLALPTEFAAP